MFLSITFTAPSSIIRGRTGVSIAPINRIRKQLKLNTPVPIGGRMSIIGQISLNLLRRKVRLGLLKTGKDAHQWLCQEGYTIGYRQTLNVMKSLDLYARVKKPKPYLRPINVTKRY